MKAFFVVTFDFLPSVDVEISVITGGKVTENSEAVYRYSVIGFITSH
jgi:hypothetical protein